MSSSLLLVLIVVVWLFVLAPLVVNRREPIRRTADALGKTRVLHRGGEELQSTRRRPTFSAGDVRKHEEIDESLETVEPQVDDLDVDNVLYDDRVDASDEASPKEQAAPAVIEGDVIYELEAAPVAESDKDESEAAQSDATVLTDADRSGTTVSLKDTAEHELSAEAESSEGPAVLAESTAKTAAAHSPQVREDFVDADDLMFADEPAEQPNDEEADASEPDADKADGSRGDANQPLALEVDDELTDEDLAFAARRSGRGWFDPVSDARYAETRFARRRRSIAGLVGIILAAIVLGVFVGGWTWWIPLVGTGLLAVYLVNLRRTVRAEEDFRRRRIRRMKLARQGVRNIEDDQFGVPQRLRRPGAVVVELDDEDPDFADLPYVEFQPTYDDDLRRVAG